MAKIMAKFVHGCAEVVRELEVDRPDDPPMVYALPAPAAAEVAAPESEPQDAWEAVYVREQHSEAGRQWVYRFCGLADPEE